MTDKVIRCNKEIDIYSKKEDNGVEFTSFKTLNSFDAVTCFGDKRLVLNGPFQVSLMKGSYKFGSQVQFKLFCNKSKGFSIEERNSSDFNTVEICLPEDLAWKLLNTLFLNLTQPKGVK